MNSTVQATRSLWMDELPALASPLSENLETEIVVVGAGLGGLTTAYLLAREGRRVIVLDGGAPGGGMTGRTTAHLSCALDDRWYELISVRGADEAQLAANAHAAAIDLIESIQGREAIDCDFARVDGFLFPAVAKDEEQLDKELEAAHRVGLSDVTLERGLSLGFPGSSPCLRFPRQARFHPLKYAAGLIAGIERVGGRLATGHVRSVEEEDAGVIVTLDDGRTVRGRAAVVATNTPIVDRVAVHTKMAPYRSYVVAGRIARGSVPDALLWDTGSPYHYVRLQPMGDADVVIVGGEDHKSGQADDMAERLARLERWARERFPAIERFEWRWSGQVMESVDYLGYLGRNPGNREVYMISGDSGQGMTHATIGAAIISDAIAGRANPWSEVFAPNRISLETAGRYIAENVNVVAQMADHLTAGDVGSVDDIAPGSGAIVRRGLQQIAAYRTPDGAVVERSAVCPHIGCVVAWNPLELCWDCPCHGSQFSAEGVVINGPATADLARLDG